MPRIIEYLKDVHDWMRYYPRGWWKSRKGRKLGILNALYAVAPIKWKRYNRFLIWLKS